MIRESLTFRSLLSRKRAVRAIAVIVFLTVSSLISSLQPARAENGPDSIADLAEKLLDAVVNISTATNVGGSAITRNRGPERPKAPDGSPFEEFFEEFFDRQQNDSAKPRRVQSLGSGFVIDGSGIIVTNNHVIEGADEITINFANGDALTAELVGKDDKTDLAVLKVMPKKPLTFVSFGSSEAMRVGDWVMAIGNPFGLTSSVTVGIVSARNRDINSGPYDNFLQTDAAINKGNSGGPLFNRNGEVIGINTAIFSPSGGGSVGVGFAVPSDTALAVIEQLREFGETRRGWLGVRIQEVTEDLAEGLGLDKARGALVAGVTETGPAEVSGIKAGDVVTKFNGRAIATMKDLPRMVADTPVGKAVDIEVLRQGKPVTLSVTLGRLEEGEKIAEASGNAKDEAENAPGAEDTSVFLGMTLEELSDGLREQYKLDGSVRGLVITAVEEGSKAAEKGISEGEVVVEVGQQPVATRKDVAERLDALKSRNRKSALFLIASADGELRFVAIKTDE